MTAGPWLGRRGSETAVAVLPGRQMKHTIALATSRDLSGAKAADGNAAVGGKKYGVTDPKDSKN